MTIFIQMHNIMLFEITFLKKLPKSITVPC